MTSRAWLLVAPAPLLAVSLFIACGGRQSAPSNGPIAAADRGRAQNSDAGFDDQGRCEYKGREDREASETAGPGAILPNVRRVYQILGTGDDRRKVLVCREIDTNLDGVKDVVRTFNDKGEALHEEADANYDGKIDTWITFAAGRISQEAIDESGDGQPDVWKYYVGGQLSRIQRSTKHNGQKDVWEFYDHGRLERIGVDVDGDGHVDRWDHDEVARRAADAAVKAEERSAGAAKVDPDAGAPDGGNADGGAPASVSGPTGGVAPASSAGSKRKGAKLEQSLKRTALATAESGRLGHWRRWGRRTHGRSSPTPRWFPRGRSSPPGALRRRAPGSRPPSDRHPSRPPCDGWCRARSGRCRLGPW